MDHLKELFKGHALEKKTVSVVAGLSCSVDLSKDQYSGYTYTPVIFIASLPVSFGALGARIILDRGSDTAED